MERKTVLVTGANRGIGLEVCRQLAKQGADVILTARDAQKGQQAADALGVRFEQLDVGDFDSIRALSNRLRSDGCKLDILINNAGVIDGAGYNKPMVELEREILETTLRINSLGPLYLTQALYPIMPKGGVVVMVSSGAGAFCSDFQTQSGWYGTSKTLLNVITRRLALDLQSFEIQVNAVCPGWVRTDMGGVNADRPVEKGAETIVWLANSGTQANGKFFRDKAVIEW